MNESCGACHQFYTEIFIRFVVRHRHRSLVNNSPFGVNTLTPHMHTDRQTRVYVQRTADCCYAYRMNFKPYCLRLFDSRRNEYIGLCATCFEVNVSKRKETAENENRKTNLYLWVKRSKTNVIVVSPVNWRIWCNAAHRMLSESISSSNSYRFECDMEEKKGQLLLTWIGKTDVILNFF